MAAQMGDHLATIDIARKEGGCFAPFGGGERGELGPHVTQYALGPVLPLYQMAA